MNADPRNPPPDMHALTDDLIDWYQRSKRTLPWRERPTPYRVMLSELMLQQTRVETVIPYFERFTARWPTLTAFASASEEEVVTEWSGLGYYSRARNLHRAARLAHRSGGLKPSLKALLALPGVGPYTAGAIASIAFDVRTPAIDGNVERVVSRLFGLTEDPKAKAGRTALRIHVETLLDALPPERHAGDFTQALMELGATVCAPRTPRCGVCPLTDECVAHRDDRVLELPRKKKKKPPVPISGVAGVLYDAGGVWMGRRPAGLLGGMWEPVGDLHDNPTPAAIEAIFADRAGIRARAEEFLGTIVHVFSHRKLTLHVYKMKMNGREGAPDGSYSEVRLVRSSEAIPLSTLTRKTLEFAKVHQVRLPLAAEAEPPGTRY